MEKVSIKQLFGKSTRRVRILSALLITAVSVVGFVYYFGVVSPSLAKAFSGTGAGSEDQPYQVSNCSQLQEMKNNQDSHYVLVSDIECADTVTWNEGKGFEPITYFTGSLDGRNYSINDMYMNRVGEIELGLVRRLAGGAEVKNLYLSKNTSSPTRTDISGAPMIGAVAAVLENGKIYNVHSALNIQARQGPVDEAGQSSVALRVGGLVGISYSDVEMSSNTGKVSVLKSEGQGRTIDIGGLVGVLSDDINGGDVYPSIEDSYARSEVDAYTTFANHGGSCGGLVGGVSASRDNKYETIKYSYSQGSVSCGGPDSNMNQASFIGAISVGGQTTSPPVITDNFTQTNTSSSYGFYGGYYINNRDSDKPVTDFHTNTFDMFATNSGFCGPTDVDGLLETICAGENEANASPNYFKTGQNSTEENGWDSNYYNYDTWDQETIWDLANADDPYPVHKTQTVRPNAPTNLAVTRDGSKLLATWDPIVGTSGRADNIVDRQLWYLDNSLNSPEWTEYRPFSYSDYMPGTVHRINNIEEIPDFAIPGKYTFKVRAVSVDAAGTVTFGLFTPNYSFATGMPETAPIVTRLQADGVMVDYAWNTTEFATSYEVQYRKVGETNWTVKGSNLTTLATRSYLAENTTYEFRVVAKNTYGQGPWSDLQTVTTGARRAYTVSTCQQLQDISNDLVGTYTLTNNIDCSSIPNFVPIGGNSEPFMGSLDGKGFTISNVTIQSDAEVVGGTFAGVGLFGVAIAANIQNITLKDSTIVGNYALDESVDTNGNGLPDVDIPNVSVSNPIDIPSSVADYNENGITSVGDLQDTQGDIVSGAGVTAADLGLAVNQFPTFAVGSLAGVYIGGGTQSNVTVTNTMVQGTIAGGVYGAVVPIPNIAELGNSITSRVSGSQVNGLSELAQLLAGVDKTLTLNNFQSSGTVNGFMGGGLIGAGTSSVGSMIGLDGDLVLQNSSSSVSVEANVGGGLMGASVSLSAGSVYFAFASRQPGAPVQETGDLITQAINTFTNTQSVIIKNSHATGTVSSCNASTGVRMGSLGGLVGFGIGTLVQDSYATGAVSSCSATTDQQFVYGGSMGGIAGILVSSKIHGSYSSGTVSANRGSGQDQAEAPLYIGSVGGLAGILIATDSDESDGNYVVDNSYATGNIDISGKNATFSLSGGLFGMFLNSGTINNSHSTSRITTNSGTENLFSLSVSGGLTGVTVGVDAASYFKSSYSFPTFFPFSKGANIVNSYATGDVISAGGNASSGQFAITGGMTGFFLGGGNITSSSATGKVVSGFPNKLIDCDNNFGSFVGATSEAVPCVSNSISGGLIGSAYGVDVPGVVSSVFQGLGIIGPSKRVTSQGLKVHDSHASGEVRGNIVGGLFGSAELEVSITKSYAEGAVRGNIAGGLVGQSGLVSVAGIAGLAVFASTQPSTSPIVVEGAPINTGLVMNQGLEALGPIEINNTYSTSPITADPYQIDVLEILLGLGPVTAPEGSDLSEIRDKIIARLPTVAGGIVGLYSTPGGSITNSYASGAITVLPSKISGTNLFDLDLPAEPNFKPKDFEVPFTSFAGGVFGVEVSVPSPDFTKVVGVLAKDVNTVDIPNLSLKPQKLENVFSASSLNVPNSSFTGATAGWLMTPLETVDKYVLGNTTTDRSKILKIDNVHYDKSKIVTTGCNGPYKSVMQIRDGFIDEIDAADGQPGDINSDIGDDRLTLDHDNSLDRGIAYLYRTNPSQNISNGLDSALAPSQTSCKFVNDNNSQPNYFKNNKTNAPMNVWNFSDVWKLKKDGYPVFVAGVSTTTPNVPPTTPGDTPSGTGTSTEVPPSGATPEEQQIFRNGTRNIARKLGFDTGTERVKGLKAILASVPLFLARSIPYSLVLLLLLLAALYAWQALKEYRELATYHRAISRLVNTKESIDGYLALTTHYLNTPVAIMNGAIELMTSLKKISPAKAGSLRAKISRFSDAAAALLVANQVSNSQTANDERIVQHKQPNPYKSKSVWMPAIIALSLIVLANILFVYAEVFNTSTYRIAVEFGLYALSVFLIALAYRYRNFFEETKEITKRQLVLETELYKKREAFIPEAVQVVTEHYQTIKIASESLKDQSEAKLFFNGLNMLGGIKDGLVKIEKFSRIRIYAPLFDVTTYVQKTIHAVNTVHKDKNISFDARINPGITTHIHPEEIKQLVDSLLDNAVKFSKENSQVQVLLFKRFNKIVLSVSDQGVGISEQKLPSLLTPFSRGTESMQYNYEGIGLGLYTDKIIADKLGGTIAIRSKLGTGTTVTITLPAHREANEFASVLVTPEGAITAH